jgi:hypothetical protein
MSKKVMLLVFSSMLLALSFSADAQQPGNVPRVGFLSQAPPAVLTSRHSGKVRASMGTLMEKIS